MTAVNCRLPSRMSASLSRFRPSRLGGSSRAGVPQPACVDGTDGTTAPSRKGPLARPEYYKVHPGSVASEWAPRRSCFDAYSSAMVNSVIVLPTGSPSGDEHRKDEGSDKSLSLGEPSMIAW